MAEYSGWSGSVSMSNPQCEMWIDWETNRDSKNGVAGHSVNIILKASRTAGYVTYGDGYLSTQVGSSIQGAGSYIEITSTNKTFKNDTHFVSGGHTSDVYIACNGKIDIYTVASGQANANVRVLANRYTITYNANGGTGAPESQFRDYLLSRVLTTSKPIRSGYTFSHWNTQPNNTGTRYNSGATYNANASVILYAIWNPNPYYITYDANGGTGAPQMQTTYHDSTIALHSATPTRTGYSFSRWNTKSDGTGTSYYPSGGYSANTSVKLYAIWSINTYPIYFNANSGVGAPSSQIKTYGTTLVLTTSKPTRTGYTFSYWNTQSNGGGTTYYSGGNYASNASVTLYAIWSIIQYTILYNTNGGEKAPSAQTKTYDVNIALSSTTPVRTGYKFLGWSTTPTGAVEYSAGQTYTSNSSLTLYAVWSRIILVVTFDGNEGTSGEGKRNVYQHDTIGALPNATKLNHKLVGWSLDKTGTQFITSTYVVLESVTVYAIWELQANCFIRQNGKYIAGMMYRKQNGIYDTGLLSIKVNGVYKETNM